MSILLIEDNKELLEALFYALDFSGFEVIQVRNGQEALKYLEQGPIPEAIFLDLMMPVLDGYAFRERKKENIKLCQIPTIIASAKTDLENIMILPWEYFLPKPFDLDELFDTLKQIGNLKSKI